MTFSEQASQTLSSTEPLKQNGDCKKKLYFNAREWKYESYFNAKEHKSF